MSATLYREFTLRNGMARAARAPQAVPSLTYADGIEAAARWVDKRREDFDAEFGAMDPDTGAFEFRSVSQEEYSWELVEVADGIRALAAPQPSPETKEPEHAHDWRFSLQDHMYKCDCGATRGDYPFGAASFKD